MVLSMCYADDFLSDNHCLPGCHFHEQIYILDPVTNDCPVAGDSLSGCFEAVFVVSKAPCYNNGEKAKQ